MSIVDGTLANATNFNAAFASKASDNTLSGTQTFDKELVVKELSTPSTPSSGYGKIYFKTDGELYIKDDAGTESQVSNQGVSNTTPTVQRFTSGSGTYTTPGGVSYIKITAIGGGGGGAGSQSGGGAGNNGGAGGTTTFGTSLITCTGGAGGVYGSAAGSSGGTATVTSGTELVKLSGAPGNPSVNLINATGFPGAASPFGGGGFGGYASNAAGDGRANTGTGGGGAGAQASSNSGGSGAAGGYCVVIIDSPSASYSYSVGAGGSAGTGTSAGGAGGSGVIIVEEFY